MCEQIRHCGSRYRDFDDEGYHIDHRLGMGMRWLSAINPVTERQPVSNEDRSLWVISDGEIYNHRELRASLIRSGHRFHTLGDAEVLVHLYEEEGTQGLSRLNGMFAFALWDSRNRSLLLVRDRFGKKPLYYAAQRDGLDFGSELKCLRAAGILHEHDREALQLYFLLGYVPDPWTPYRSIRKLAPGGWLRCDASGSIEEGCYWKLPVPAARPSRELSEMEACDSVRHAFDEAVQRHLDSDVLLGAFLGGGIGSASVVASMALQSHERIKTFSIGFDEPESDELTRAAAVAKKYRTEHYAIVLRPDSVDLTRKLARHFDEPFADPSAISMYLLSEFAAPFVKVAISGDGGNELFAGHENFLQIQRLRLLDYLPGLARGVMSRVADLLPNSAPGKNFLWSISRPSALERYFAGVSPHYWPHGLAPGWMPPADGAFLIEKLSQALPLAKAMPGGGDALAQALYFEARAKLPAMLAKADRTSMANSLEVRYPFLDHPFAELAARIPIAWKLKNGRGKDIFIRAVGHRLPPDLLRQSAREFGVPLASWLRGPLRSFVWDHLTSRRFLSREIISREFSQGMLSENDRGRRDNHLFIWKLLMLELWFQEEGRLVAAPAQVEECAV